VFFVTQTLDEKKRERKNILTGGYSTCSIIKASIKKKVKVERVNI
jgi:hypothetical protein